MPPRFWGISRFASPLKDNSLGWTLLVPRTALPAALVLTGHVMEDGRDAAPAERVDSQAKIPAKCRIWHAERHSLWFVH